MNLAQKLTFVGVAIATGVPAAFGQSVDPAVTGEVEQTSPAEQRSGNANSRGLIERGRQLFMNETFDGNGRTCATCHPPTNNFTIDPAFIASLPDDDPLFVAEFNPDLAELEHPDMLRNFGLVLENVDGLDKPGVFRGVPHTLGLRVSIAVDPAGDDNLTRSDGSTVVHATGWSGDGAPGDGSLRSFAIGAVVQHFPKTLNRVEGKDFRLPTDAELDALEAFQFSLGRQSELDLTTMFFADDQVAAGKDLFNGIGTNRACSSCHANAGANNDEGFNKNFATNAAHMATDARGFDPAMPGDGGFDSGPEFEVPGIAAKFYGNGRMNSASLVEAADTPPFFHNRIMDSIESPRPPQSFQLQFRLPRSSFQLSFPQRSPVLLQLCDGVARHRAVPRAVHLEDGRRAGDTVAADRRDLRDRATGFGEAHYCGATQVAELQIVREAGDAGNPPEVIPEGAADVRSPGGLVHNHEGSGALGRGQHLHQMLGARNV
jgi:cytochrome c peroxidase